MLMRISAAPSLGYYKYQEYRTGDTGFVWYEMSVLLFYGPGGLLSIKIYARQYCDKKA